MIQDDFGTLMLQTEHSPVAGEPAFWSLHPLNSAALAVSALLILIALPALYRLMPAIAGCFDRRRGVLELEHNLQYARIRDRLAWVLAVPFCAIADRFALYRPEWAGSIPEEWHLAVTAGAALAFVLIRWLTGVALMPSYLRGDDRMAVRRGIYSFFIPLVILTVFSTGAMHLLHASDMSIRSVILIGTAVIYLISIIREMQILRSNCSGFTTFLYLCALEIIPAAILVVSATVF